MTKTSCMKIYGVDLHLHTVLSPCAELEMGPVEIVHKARESGRNIMAVTDHNSCLNYPALAGAAGTDGPLFIPGMEVQTVEDIHVVTLFPDYERALVCQKWLWSGLPDIKNRVDLFGYQLVVNAKNDILDQVERLLLQGASWTVDQVISRVHELDGIVILAHVDRPAFSYPSVLGFIPDDLDVDALELSRNVDSSEFMKWLSAYPSRTFIRSSDAHRLDEMDRFSMTWMKLNEPSFSELKIALRSHNSRQVLPL